MNRCLAPFMVEVTALVQEGVDLPLIDKSMKAFGMPVGPITLSGASSLLSSLFPYFSSSLQLSSRSTMFDDSLLQLSQ